MFEIRLNKAAMKVIILDHRYKIILDFNDQILSIRIYGKKPKNLERKGGP
jgi:hypothetical protein